jgi:hypothetical protein
LQASTLQASTFYKHQHCTRINILQTSTFYKHQHFKHQYCKHEHCKHQRSSFQRTKICRCWRFSIFIVACFKVRCWVLKLQ